MRQQCCVLLRQYCIWSNDILIILGCNYYIEFFFVYIAYTAGNFSCFPVIKIKNTPHVGAHMSYSSTENTRKIKYKTRWIWKTHTIRTNKKDRSQTLSISQNYWKYEFDTSLVLLLRKQPLSLMVKKMLKKSFKNKIFFDNSVSYLSIYNIKHDARGYTSMHLGIQRRT